MVANSINFKDFCVNPISKIDNNIMFADLKEDIGAVPSQVSKNKSLVDGYYVFSCLQVIHCVLMSCMMY